MTTTPSRADRSEPAKARSGQAQWLPGEAALRLTGIHKHFGDAHVLKDVSIELHRGKVIALLGENGSGKSTLIKILSGFYEADPGGEIRVGGHPLPTPVTPSEAHASGLRFVHQDLGLVEEMSISDNVSFVAGYGTPTIGAIRRRENRERVTGILGRLDLDWDPKTAVSELSPAQRTMLAISRVLDDRSADESPRVLVLDEPTASLPATEVALVFDAIRRVTGAGGTVLYVSHRIDEVLEIADELIVLRDGRIITQQSSQGLSHEDIVSLLLGRALERVQQRTHAEYLAVEKAEEILLTLRGIGGTTVQSVDLDVRKGEIVGIGGLSGCGRSELVRLIAGAQQPTRGTMTLAGKPYAPASPGQAIKAGVTYVPEDRRNHGCIGELSLQQNLTLLDFSSFSSAFFLNKRKESREAKLLIERFDIRPPDATRPIAKFSGGNQQKAVLAKALRVGPKIIVLDEPTQGIDIGAKNDISARILELARTGTTVILASSEQSELAALCDRLIILDRGEVKAVLDQDAISPDRITLLTTGSVQLAEDELHETDHSQPDAEQRSDAHAR